MKALTHSTTPEKQKDRAATPWPVFRRIEQVLGITFAHDVCAEPHTAKVQSSFWTAADNALDDRCWSESFPPLTPLWMNPPYSNPAPWVQKAVMAAANGLIVVGLVPDITSSAWYRDYLEDVATAAYRPDGRINFLGHDGKPMTGNPWPSVVPVWTPWQTGKTSWGRFARKVEAVTHITMPEVPGLLQEQAS